MMTECKLRKTETAASGFSFGVHLPCRMLPGGDSQPVSHELLVAMVDAAKDAGCASIWVTDHIIYPDPWMDCLLLLATIAGRAKENGLTIATGIVGLPLRHPVTLAQSFATLDILSGGKLIIGVGEGSTESDFAALGISFEERRKMLEDGVVALRALLTKTHVSHEGPYYRFHDITVSPRSVRRPCPPIWLSSWGAPAGMRRVARLGDGWVASAWHSTPEQFHSALRALNAALAELGKDPKNFPNAVDTVFMFADPDRARARRLAVPIVERAMRAPFDPSAGHCLVGDYSECKELLQRWLAAGAQQLCVWPLLDPVRQIRRFGEHILQCALDWKITPNTPLHGENDPPLSGRSYSLAARPSRQWSIQAKCFHPAGTFVEFSKDEIHQSIPARFAQQARKYPDRLAVKTRTQELTYEELNRAANLVARVLIEERGSGAEPIATLFEQGASVIVAILAVLKAGKFYLPLDPAYPQARTATMLADSQAGVVLTNAANLPLARVLAGTARQVISLDELGPSIFSTENVEAPVSPDDIAYLIYTSGSTGQPKGVVQTHRNVLHDIRNYTNAFHICRDDRLIALHSYSFADTTRTTNAALLNGASLYLLNVGKEGLVPVAEWLMRHEITIYRSVPTTFRQFVRTLTGDEYFAKLRLVYMAGEPVYSRDVDLYKRYFTEDCIFINGMGSTECLTHCWYFIDKETTIDGHHVPIGHALEDVEILLLGDDGREVGVNQTGEIAIKSRYLSPGYWRKPELTSAAFLSDPDDRAEQTYRTGDLGLIAEDGCVVHAGRKDFQVKVRGHRVELTEIEAALLSLDKIKEAIVTVREAEPGDPRLVAYLVAAEAPAPGPVTLRNELAKKLPGYMIPSTFMFLDALPLLPNGKLDRSALPALASNRPQLETPYVAPGSPTEILLGEIWAEVLGLDRVGLEDNFVDLGGHSLTATQIITRVIRELRVELPLQSLLDAPTVGQMARLIVRHQAQHAGEDSVGYMLAELEALSENEAKRLLADQSAT